MHAFQFWFIWTILWILPDMNPRLNLLFYVFREGIFAACRLIEMPLQSRWPCSVLAG